MKNVNKYVINKVIAVNIIQKWCKRKCVIQICIY